MRRLKLF